MFMISFSKWKRFLLTGLSAVLLTGMLGFAGGNPAAAAETDPADIPNGGFEEPANGTGIPNWSPYSPNGQYTLNNTIYYAGTSSLKMIDPTASASVGMQSKRVPVTAGTAYRVTAQVYAEEGSPGLYLYFYDAAGKQLKSYSRGAGAVKGQWTAASIEGEAPAGTVSASALLYSGVSNTGTYYFDEVHLTEMKQLDLQLPGPLDLGEPVQVPGTANAVIARTASGENEMYLATNGAPATFYVMDAETLKPKFEWKLPHNEDVVWAITKASDGNIYFAGTNNGILYRYKPEERKVEEIGKNPSDTWVWELEGSSDGKIYGATYPRSKVFEYDIASNTFRDLGTVREGEQYARGIGVTDRYLYVGIGTTAYLYRIDRVTGEKTEVPIPNRGTVQTIANIQEYNGKLLVRSGSLTLFVIDASTGALINTIPYESEVSEPSPLNPNLVYYKKGSSLYSYNLATNEIQQIPNIPPLSENGVKRFAWMVPNSGPLAGKTLLVGLIGATEFFTYDPQTGSMEVRSSNIPAQGVQIQSLEVSPEGKLYVGAFLQGMSVYNPPTRSVEHNLTSIPQPEGIGFLNGNTYFGTYGGAVIYRYDPTKPFQFERTAAGNPGLFYDIGDDQSRPFTFETGPNQLFVGTIPDYGRLGGALSIYDEPSGKWSVYPNVVQDQSIIGLAYKDGKLYGGTSIWGGGGSNPATQTAKLFVWDTVKNEKIAEWVPQIPGIDVQPKMLGELSAGPDGLIWGAADGTIFAFDPNTLQVVRSKTIYPSMYNTSTWRPYHLRWGQDGLLYTTLGRKLTVVDPNTLAFKLVEDQVDLMTLADDGIYYAKGSHLMVRPYTLASVDLSATGTNLHRGETTPLQLDARLTNGKPAPLVRASVTYTSSNPAVASVQQGNLQAGNTGTAEIRVSVTLDGVTLQSLPFTITVTADLISLRASVDRYSADGSLAHPLAAMLGNALDQAEHQRQAGDSSKAAKHLEDFLKHLEQLGSDQNVSDSVRSALQSDASYVLSSLQK